MMGTSWPLEITGFPRDLAGLGGGRLLDLIGAAPVGVRPPFTPSSISTRSA
jgi:hypothetical protein